MKQEVFSQDLNQATSARVQLDVLTPTPPLSLITALTPSLKVGAVNPMEVSGLQSHKTRVQSLFCPLLAT